MAPGNSCYYLKDIILHDEFVTNLKNQIQQNKENGKLSFASAQCKTSTSRNKTKDFSS